MFGKSVFVNKWQIFVCQFVCHFLSSFCLTKMFDKSVFVKKWQNHVCQFVCQFWFVNVLSFFFWRKNVEQNVEEKTKADVQAYKQIGQELQQLPTKRCYKFKNNNAGARPIFGIVVLSLWFGCSKEFAGASGRVFVGLDLFRFVYFQCFCYFWLLFRSLSCLESCGRLVGAISTKFRPNPSSWDRVMTKKRKKLTSKK